MAKENARHGVRAEIPFYVHSAVGSIAGGMAAFIVQPMDVIKTRLQQLNKNPKYTGVGATFKTIIREEGIPALWKGSMPTIYRVLPGAGMHFLFLNKITNLFQSEQGKNLTPLQNFLAASMSRSLTTTILCPITVVKTRFEVASTGAYNIPKYTSTWNALVTIAKNEGLAGMYSGLIATLIRDVPYAGMSYLFYEQGKLYIQKNTSLPLPTMVVNATAAGLAGGLATVLTHPSDVIKTRMQMPGRTYPGVFAAVIAIYKKEGVHGFFKGIVPRTTRRILVMSFTWVLYEEIVAAAAIRAQHNAHTTTPLENKK